MKRFVKSMLGVTLLEIMLVLAIAAMIIVMSVRYYQSATASQQANVAMQQIQGYLAAADGLAGGGSYSNVSASGVKSIVGTVNSGPPANLTTIASQTTSGFDITITFEPTTLCPPVRTQLINSFGKRIGTTVAACTTGGGLTFTYSPRAGT